MKIKEKFFSRTGQPVLLTPETMISGTPPEMEAVAAANDPGFIRALGYWTQPEGLVDARGQRVVAVLVETGDPDGNDWLEVTSVTNAYLAVGRILIEADQADLERRKAEPPAPPALPAPVETGDGGGEYRPSTGDHLRDARNWAEDGYRCGDSWSDD